MSFRFLAPLAAAAMLSSYALAQSPPVAVETDRYMVVTANPLASAAGEKILRVGGTAADAMIAVQAVLGLVEPQSSGIGGGAFIVYYDAKSGTLTTIDAREKAPAAATEDRFLDENGDSIGFFAAWQSGLSAGVPGVPRMLSFMHERYGKLPRWVLFRRAERLARKGFEITQRTEDQVNALLGFNASCTDRVFFRDQAAFEYFTDADPVNCAARPAGTLQTNPDYARLMRKFARKGTDIFYEGEIADAVVEAVTTDPAIPGDMTVADLAAYEVVERAPVCIDYRGYEVCGMGPPSSGGLAVGQILGMLENFDFGESGDPLDDLAVHRFTMAGRLAFADRNLYVGDSDFVTVPIEGMLDKDYLAERAALIGEEYIVTALPGELDGFDPNAPADTTAKNSGTSHVSIVDRFGNALSMTTTIESSFGNGVFVPGFGFLLNNQLTDFAFTPESSDGVKIANRVQPNKRPRSSMSPSIVLDEEGEVFYVTGSPGGSRIIAYTAQSITNRIDFGLDPQEAINTPHYMNRNTSTTDIEMPITEVTGDYDVAGLQAALAVRGHPVSVRELTSGLSVIEVVRETVTFGRFKKRKFERTSFVGGADTRRDGTVAGR